MIIIPAIDIIGGKCVRLTQGDYNQKIEYNSNPLEVAKFFEGNGLNYLHVVDLDGAKAGKIVNYQILEQITHRTKLKVDFGGGLKSNDDLKTAFECGANQVTGGNIAVKNKALFLHWLEQFGAEKIILGDVLNTQNKALLFNWMKDNTTGYQRIRAGVPLGWSVADKTGSGRYGIANDIGIVWSPSCKPIILSLFTISATQNAKPNDRVIADITEALLSEFAQHHACYKV